MSLAPREHTAPVIEASALTKAYARAGPMRVAWGRLTGRTPPLRLALSEVDFRLEAGESIGIMGPNGAGKSTLLRLLIGALRATSGELVVRGRAMLLDLGATLTPELTGLDNVRAVGLAAGLSGAEIERRLDDIARFSELGEALAQPVRTYSTGMRLRLSFSLFTHTDLDILLIDEAFAVGDARFVLKCITRLKLLQHEGLSLVLVSHDGNAIRELCDRALLLDSGTLACDGDPMTVVERYHAMLGLGNTRHAVAAAPPEIAPSQSLALSEFLAGSTRPEGPSAHGQEFEILGARLLRNGTPCTGVLMHGDHCTVQWAARAHLSLSGVTSGIHLHARNGAYVFGTSYAHLGHAFDVVAGESYLLAISFELLLGPGYYALSIGTAKPDVATHSTTGFQFDRALAVLDLEVMDFELGLIEPVPFFGLVRLPAAAVVPRRFKEGDGR